MEQSLTFNLTVTQANTILQALAELPFRVSQPLIQELQEQAQGQLQDEEHPSEE